MTERPKTGPWVVICALHGQVVLLDEEYDYQLARADRGWGCPLCGQSATWDDDNYADWLEREGGK